MKPQAILMRRWIYTTDSGVRSMDLATRLYRLTEPYLGSDWLLVRRAARNNGLWFPGRGSEHGEPDGSYDWGRGYASLTKLFDAIGYEEVVP